MSSPWAPASVPESPSGTFVLSFPAAHTLVVTINRPRARNSIPSYGHWEAAGIFDWFDSEPELRVAIITGAGNISFCAGQDLVEQYNVRAAQNGVLPAETAAVMSHPPSGFAGMTCRTSKKPIIAAVNGFALGGGFEVVLNCDMTVASPSAQFGLPEALRGLYASAGGLPRLVRNVGMPLASEITLTGRQLSSQEALKLGLINRISASTETVLDEALAMAQEIAKLSPDGVIVTKAALRQAWETSSVIRATSVIRERFDNALIQGENVKIGLEAFATKTKPEWKPSRL